MKVKITKTFFNWNNKEGQPYLSKEGQPQCRVQIQTEQHGKTYLSSFALSGSPILEWKPGDIVDIEIKTQGDFTNFYLPKPKAAPQQWKAQSVQMPANQEEMLTLLRRIDEKVDQMLGYDYMKVKAANDELGRQMLPPLE